MDYGLFHSNTSLLLVTYLCSFSSAKKNSEINLTEIEPYIDYLVEKQGVKSIFGKFAEFRFPCFSLPTVTQSNIKYEYLHDYNTSRIYTSRSTSQKFALSKNWKEDQSPSIQQTRRQLLGLETLHSLNKKKQQNECVLTVLLVQQG